MLGRLCLEPAKLPRCSTLVAMSVAVLVLGLLRAVLLPDVENTGNAAAAALRMIQAEELSRLVALIEEQNRDMKAMQWRRQGLLKEWADFAEVVSSSRRELEKLDDMGDASLVAEVARAQGELVNLQRSLLTSMEEVPLEATKGSVPTDENCVNADGVLEEIENALQNYAADGTGRRDFANSAVGGRVVKNQRGMTSSTYTPSGWIGSDLMHSMGLENGIGSVDSVIAQISTPGRCWAMEGKSGRVSIRLAKEIIVEAITLEHNSRSSSAPKEFEVYGLTEGKAVKLGEGSYDLSGPSIQTFALETPSPQFQIVQLRVLSNWGTDHTCIYRVRVHGREP